MNLHILKPKASLRTLSGILCLLFSFSAFSQSYWQQEVNYDIAVSLNDKSHSLDGFVKISYTNNSPDTLHYIWFHLWPNAYKNDKTAFTDQALENGSTKFYFSEKEKKGYINRLDFKVDGITSKTEDHPQHIDIIKVVLPTALAPGKKILITTPFFVRLPNNFSRSGHEEQSYQVTQWYPKPAVYDRQGWHPMPYLDQGEFYSEYGTFDVRITVPENYVVAATGDCQNKDEIQWLLTQRSESTWGKQYRLDHPMGKYDTVMTFLPGDGNNPGEYGTRLKKATDSISNIIPASAINIKTLHFRIDKAHDFAWFADKRFIVGHDTLLLENGRTIDVFSYYTPRCSPEWKKTTKYIKDAIRHYSSHVGNYPYAVASAVQGPDGYNGGMEYPTITIISPDIKGHSLDKVIAHEVGHNWFYGILGSNERAYPWLDEGINSYYESLYKAGEKQSIDVMGLAFETKAVTKTDQPINTPSEKFSYANYGLVGYFKTSEWVRYLASEMGADTFTRAMRNYYTQWQFRHPAPADFRKVMESVSGRNLDHVFSLLDKPGLLPTQERKGSTFSLLFDLNKLSAYAKKPTKNLFLAGPAFGGNSYDKFMAGAFFTNIKFPPTAFQFLIVPMYSTGAKSLTGLGLAKYSHYSYGFVRRIDIGVSASTFTMDQFTGSDGTKASLAFRKIVPGIKFTFREKNPRSTIHKHIRFRTFLINEDQLQFYRDTVISLPDTIVTTKFRTIDENRTLNQLELVIQNNRVLYPYRGLLRIEQGKDFLRTAFTGNYFFNYPKGGGLDVRLFAGKFFYTSSKTFTKQFQTDRYHLNMTGANGYEDYTYSDYFIGRNKFEGFASQQIMVRDGGFKVRTDLLSNKVGKTDNWLAAVNLSTTIPASVNPLNLLPIKIPLKLFLDIGTHAEAWEQDSESDRFLYDAGLHIPLLRETINIYIPLLYSNVYRDYIQSTIVKKERFWKKISFSIDISNFSARKIDRNLDF